MEEQKQGAIRARINLLELEPPPLELKYVEGEIPYTRRADEVKLELFREAKLLAQFITALFELYSGDTRQAVYTLKNLLAEEGMEQNTQLREEAKMELLIALAVEEESENALEVANSIELSEVNTSNFYWNKGLVELQLQRPLAAAQSFARSWEEKNGRVGTKDSTSFINLQLAFIRSASQNDLELDSALRALSVIAPACGFPNSNAEGKASGSCEGE